MRWPRMTPARERMSYQVGSVCLSIAFIFVIMVSLGSGGLYAKVHDDKWAAGTVQMRCGENCLHRDVNLAGLMGMVSQVPHWWARAVAHHNSTYERILGVDAVSSHGIRLCVDHLHDMHPAGKRY